MRTFAFGTIALSSGCALIAGLLDILQVFLLGVMPEAGFSDANSLDHGLATIAVGAIDEVGVPIAPAAALLDVETDDGAKVSVVGSDEVEGAEAGSMVMLSDGSASMIDSDPLRYRETAVGQLAGELNACGAEWRMALMEFGAGTSGSFSDTRVHVDYTTDPTAIADGAANLDASNDTPLWDSLFEVLDSLDSDASTAFVEDDAGRGLVVLSDGADTASSRDIDSVIARALEKGIPVDAIGLGASSDLDLAGWSDDAAVADLRRLALETGGYYASATSAAELPDIAEAIARAHCGGHARLLVKWDDPPAAGTLVTGRVKVRGTGIEAPFGFVAP